jgi:hypothetical protein
MATTTNYSWTTPDNTAYVKDGASAIRTLGSSVDTTLFTALGGTYPGLRLVKTQTIGSAVSSISVTNAFSATYDNYKIMITGSVGSVNNVLLMNMTGSTASYSGSVIFASYAGGAVGNAPSAATSFPAAADLSTTGCSSEVTLFEPFLAKFTGFRANHSVMNVAGSAVAINGVHALANSYTGFTLTASTGTVTGGTIYVYGYGKS